MLDDIGQIENKKALERLSDSLVDEQIIRVHSVSLKRGGRVIAENINLTLKQGEVIYIQGPNGAGKSTLLRVVAQLLQPSEGEVICTSPYSYLGHKSGLDPYSQVNTIICPHKQDKLIALLKYFSINNICNLHVQMLSQGQQRIVGVIRVILEERPIWILDEPYEALDDVARKKLDSLIRQHVDKGGSVILTSHIAPGIDGMKVYRLESL